VRITRKQPNEFSSLERLCEYGLLTPQEYEYMRQTTLTRYIAPFAWFLSLVQELKDKGYCGVDNATLRIFCDSITSIRGSLAYLYLYHAVPIPLAYRQLVNWTVRTYMVFFAVAGCLRSIIDDDGNLGGLTPSVFLLLLPFSFELFMFLGWLFLADALGNPYRSWTDGFEYEKYVQSVSLTSNQTITASRDACPPLDQVDKVAPSLKERQAATFARWEKELDDQNHHEPLRELLTGF